jgi:hypothetical protein
MRNTLHRTEKMMEEAKFTLSLILIKNNITWNQIRLRLILTENDIKNYDTKSEQFIICYANNR